MTEDMGTVGGGAHAREAGESAARPSARPLPTAHKRMTAAERRSVAIHEAGHAVADVVLGIPVEYTSIRPGKTFAGIEVPAPFEVDLGSWNQYLPISAAPADLRAYVEKRIIAFLAGPIAAVILYEPVGRGAPVREEFDPDAIARQALANLGPRLAELVVAKEESDEPNNGDEANAFELANAFVGPDMGGAFYLEWLRVEARALVVRYAAAILRVADALERHAILQGDQVAALIHPPKEDRPGSAPSSTRRERATATITRRSGGSRCRCSWIGMTCPG